jgi:hypothetical protein
MTRRWSNVKALQGEQWKGRLRKRVGPYRIIFREYPERGALEISAILIKGKAPIGNSVDRFLARRRLPPEKLQRISKKQKQGRGFP